MRAYAGALPLGPPASRSGCSTPSCLPLLRHLLALNPSLRPAQGCLPPATSRTSTIGRPSHPRGRVRGCGEVVGRGGSASWEGQPWALPAGSATPGLERVLQSRACGCVGQARVGSAQWSAAGACAANPACLPVPAAAGCMAAIEVERFLEALEDEDGAGKCRWRGGQLAVHGLGLPGRCRPESVAAGSAAPLPPPRPLAREPADPQPCRMPTCLPAGSTAAPTLNSDWAKAVKNEKADEAYLYFNYSE